MMNVDEILARLQNGETMDDIAADISKTLTIAEHRFQKEKEKKAAEIAALEKEAKLNDLAETILLAAGEYISVKCPEAIDAEDIDMEVAEFRELLDELLDSIVAMKGLFGAFAAPAFNVPKTEPKAPKKLKTADDKIADFLKAMGL